MHDDKCVSAQKNFQINFTFNIVTLNGGGRIFQHSNQVLNTYFHDPLFVFSSKINKLKINRLSHIVIWKELDLGSGDTQKELD